MKELVKVKGHDIFTDSLVIAKGTENSHKSVKNLIAKYEKEFLELGRVVFKKAPFDTNGGEQDITYYDLNEPQATFLMTLLRNSKEVVEFKLELTKEFYRMRQFILERQSAEWQETRLSGKHARRDETDVILEKLIPLAESQGSKNAGKLYMTYSKLVNSMLGIEAGQRDNLPMDYVGAIRFLEHAISNIISIEVDKDTYYKDIYQICKVKCQVIKELAFLPSLKQISA
jgi:phage regulator Rha-like protein